MITQKICHITCINRAIMQSNYTDSTPFSLHTHLIYPSRQVCSNIITVVPRQQWRWLSGPSPSQRCNVEVGSGPPGAPQHTGHWSVIRGVRGGRSLWAELWWGIHPVWGWQSGWGWARGSENDFSPTWGRRREKTTRTTSLFEMLFCMCALDSIPLLQHGLLCAQVGHFISQQANLPLIVIKSVPLPLRNLQLLMCRSQTEAQTQFISAILYILYYIYYILYIAFENKLSASPTLLSVVIFRLRWRAEWLLICSLSHPVRSERQPICLNKENI